MFTDHPAVAQAASGLVVDVLGEDGRRGARAVIGVAGLRRNSAVDIHTVRMAA